MLTVVACTSKKKVVSDDFATDATEATESTAELDSATAELGFSDEDLSLDGKSSTKEVAKKSTEPMSDELSLENELQSVASESIGKPIDEPVATPEPIVNNTTPVPLAVPEPVAPPTPVIVQEPTFTPAPVIDETPAPEVIAPKISLIKEVQFKSNDSGGALMIHADEPLSYTSRVNTATNQVIIEVQNVQVPNKLKRPLNTKDMTSSIGHIDIYQKENSNIARFVIQLRPNTTPPLIQPEGTSLMIIGSQMGSQSDSQVVSKSTDNTSNEKNSSIANSANHSQNANGAQANKNSDSFAANEPKFKIANDPSEGVEINPDLTSESIMNTTDMDEYLANNTKFYGKKISIETNDMSIKDVLKFISEESGVNMIFDDAISGSISLKLRKVPWDQAFVLVLKSKGLSYRRQGTVLRIASTSTLVKEEEEALKIKDSKTTSEPLVVKNFAVNYADIGDLEKKLQDYISSDTASKTKGRITSDKRTNMLIVTETPTKLKQVEALIRAIDTQPQQVMIEARVIEASETFGKSIGADWGLNRGTAFNGSRINTNVGQPWSDPEPIKVSPLLGFTSPQSAAGSFKSSLWFGKLGVLGDLDIQLALQESEDKIKILSTPRVTVLTNTQATINQSFKVAQGTTSSTGTNGITTTETKFVDVGVKLNVTPQISNLGTIRMVLDVVRTGVQPGGATNSRDMKTEVIVKSGDTTVIGGVFQSDVIVSKTGVPGLKDIPILGTLFRGQSDSHTKTELMVFVTPKILAPVVPTLNAAESTTEASPVQVK